MRSVALIDDAFIETNAVPGEPDWTPGPAAQEPWNILFFVLESTGADYVFDTSLGNDVPMPFLHHAATNGVWLANHYSTCNSSPRAGFSIFTGLYPRADHDQTFEVEHHVSIPALNRYLGTPFQCFVVHPASLTYCFPLGVLYNSGFHLLRDRKNIPPGARPDPTPLARNELESVDVLLHHLDTAREPFFGIYWTYVPHHPYSDYGPEYRVLPDL